MGYDWWFYYRKIKQLAFEIYNKLKETNFQTRLLIYENEDHGLQGVLENLIDNICSWLKQKL